MRKRCLNRLLHLTCTGFAASAHVGTPYSAKIPCFHRALSTQTNQSTQILDGRATSAVWMQEMTSQVPTVTKSLGRPPCLAVVLVGNRPDSLLYVTRKQEAALQAGLSVQLYRLPETVSQQQLQDSVTALSKDSQVDGVLVQLPLPSHLNEERVMEAIDPAKDVDGFHPLNMGRMLMRGRSPTLVPCTALGVSQLLDRAGISVMGTSVVVLGDSNIVGTPLAALLRDKGAAAVTVCHRTSYQQWYADCRDTVSRAAADACLPRLPGPTIPQFNSGPVTASQLPSTGCSNVLNESGRDKADSDTHCTVPGCDQSSISSMAGNHTLGSSQSSTDGQISATGSTTKHQQQQQQQEQQGRGVCLGSWEASRDLPALTRTADILVVAVGVPQLVRGSWVKPGAVVVDVGINVVQGASDSQQSPQQTQQAPQQDEPLHGQLTHTTNSDMDNHVNDGHSGCGDNDAVMSIPGGGSYGDDSASEQAGDGQGSMFTPGTYLVVGDVHFQEVSQVASAITPVPGGVGPMTIAAVLHNTLAAAKMHAQSKQQQK